ncbi:MAG: hypothetical protein LBE33_06190 [Zoogloeaceae bacterium]|jgi:DNA-binding phage protein|nr:hypothetical protein [Zoogloeaceae bacterium]
MALKTIPYDIANPLDNEKVIQEYFSQVLEDSDSDKIIRTLGRIARAFARAAAG